MGSREDVFKAKIALQDSIRAEKDPKKKKAMQKRFDKMRIPTHSEVEKGRNDKLRAKTGIIPVIKQRQAMIDSLRKVNK